MGYKSKEGKRTRRGKKRRVRSFSDVVEMLYSAASTKPKKRAPSRRAKIVKTKKSRKQKLTGGEKIKLPVSLGKNHYEYVCNCGPYISGFYNVKEIEKINDRKGTGTIGVFRRSAAEMRRFSTHRDPVCP